MSSLKIKILRKSTTLLTRSGNQQATQEKYSVDCPCLSLDNTYYEDEQNITFFRTSVISDWFILFSKDQKC